MKKFAFTFFILFALSAVISAQSGRRVAPEPTPDAQKIVDEANYSESKPNPKRPQYIPPKRVREERARRRAENRQTTVPENVSDGDVIEIESNLVTIPVSVFDRYGLYVPGLREEEFSIFEEGEEQEIAYFGISDKPISVLLLLDTSPSTEYKIEEIQAAAKSFVRLLKPEDQVMVIEFDGNSHVLTKFTKDRRKIDEAIDDADFGYGTSIYDAVEMSLVKYLSQVQGRKAIVLFTDGVDTTSTKATYDDTLYEAEESGALIFPIYYNTFQNLQNNSGGIFGRVINPIGTRPQDYALGRKYIQDLADLTGGRVFKPESTPGGLTRAFEGIAEELRRQYNLGYYPTETGKPGERRKIKVRVARPNLVIRSRDSYIVGETISTAN